MTDHPLYQRAKTYIELSGDQSCSGLQRHFSIGYTSAKSLWDSLKENLIILDSEPPRALSFLGENAAKWRFAMTGNKHNGAATIQFMWLEETTHTSFMAALEKQLSNLSTAKHLAHSNGIAVVLTESSFDFRGRHLKQIINKIKSIVDQRCYWIVECKSSPLSGTKSLRIELFASRWNQ
jgi:hypothetical protein